MTNYHTSSPVLFLVFNRPDTTALVFEQIRQAQPARLYIAADGPRKSKAGEEQLCAQTRKITEKIDWNCEVKTLFRDQNLGCKYAVSAAITWFFEQEEEGIILEDDCLPANDFFRFCDDLLARYRNDSRVFQITGCNVQFGKKWGEASYYFSNNIEVWGWASWRRVWKYYDPELQSFTKAQAFTEIEKLYGDADVALKFTEIFEQLKEKKIDTWDYQLRFLCFFNNALCAVPNINLITNIGFRSDGTHTVTESHPYANIATGTLAQEIIHPNTFVPFKNADLDIFREDLGIKKKKLSLLDRVFKR